jgi:hypothetical protein
MSLLRLVLVLVLVSDTLASYESVSRFEKVSDTSSPRSSASQLERVSDTISRRALASWCLTPSQDALSRLGV